MERVWHRAKPETAYEFMEQVSLRLAWSTFGMGHYWHGAH
jgi:hypothetical protein